MGASPKLMYIDLEAAAELFRSLLPEFANEPPQKRCTNGLVNQARLDLVNCLSNCRHLGVTAETCLDHPYFK